MQSSHTRSACPDCSQKTLLPGLTFPIAELWTWKHTACAEQTGHRLTHSTQNTFVLSLSPPLTSSCLEDTHTDVNGPSALPPTQDCLFTASQPKITSKISAGSGEEGRRERKNHIISATILSEGKLDYLNVKFLRYLHGLPFKNTCNREMMMRIKMLTFSMSTCLSLMCMKESRKWQAMTL